MQEQHVNQLGDHDEQNEPMQEVERPANPIGQLRLKQLPQFHGGKA